MEEERDQNQKKGIRGRKILLLILAAAAAVFLVVRCRAAGQPDGLPVSVITLERRPLKEVLAVSGPVSGTDSVDVVSSIHAEILEIHVKEGDKVTKGQILAELDRTDLEREVEVARNAWELARVNKEQKDKEEKLGYEKAVQDLQKAQTDYSRSSVLFASGDISQAEMEVVSNTLNDARRAVEGYTVEGGRGVADPSYELQIQSAACELEKKEEALENTQIKSAIDGTVVRVNSKVGQFADKVENDKPMFSIENLDQLEMKIPVSEYSIGKVQVGQQVQITADILGGEAVQGQVVKISPTGEEKGGGSTERVIPITIQITSQDTRLIAGITARAEILIQQSDQALTVPMTALLEDGSGTSVAVVENQTIRRIPVTVGVDGDVNVEILPQEGYELKEGMEVVVNPDPQMADGAKAVIVSRQEGL